MIKESPVTGESVLAELTMSSVDELNLQDSNESIKLNQEIDNSDYIKKESKKNLENVESLIYDKVNTFLALLCSRRESIQVKQAS
jgi:hypothetical protein